MHESRKILSPIVLLGAVAVIAVVAVAGFLVFGGDDGDEGKSTRTAATGAVRYDGPEIAPFRLTVPSSWERVNQKVVEQAGKTNSIAVQKRDGTGLISVSVEGPLKQSLNSLRTSLVRAVDKREVGMKLSESRTVKVAAGPAVYTSWTAKNGETVTTNLVVPDGKITYTVDAVVDAKALETAAEVGKVLRGFDSGR